MRRIYDVAVIDDLDVIEVDECLDIEVETYRYYHMVVRGPMEAWWRLQGQFLYENKDFIEHTL